MLPCAFQHRAHILYLQLLARSNRHYLRCLLWYVHILRIRWWATDLYKLQCYPFALSLGGA